MNKPIRVAILEDLLEIAEQLKNILDQDVEISLVAHYLSAEEAIRSDLPSQRIDVFLVDLGLPGIDGLAFIERCRKLCPAAQYVVHTVSESSKDLMAALSAGAVGYVLKGSGDIEICNSLKIVAKGGGLLSPRMARRLVKYFSEAQSPKEVLTPTEINVLKKLKTGLTYAEIAELNSVSQHTIHTHVKNIYRKLNVGNREDAVKNALLFDVIDQ